MEQHTCHDYLPTVSEWKAAAPLLKDPKHAWTSDAEISDRSGVRKTAVRAVRILLSYAGELEGPASAFERGGVIRYRFPAGATAAE